MNEIINIHVGQAGVQLGNSFWELICSEHGIQEDGFLHSNYIDTHEKLEPFFSRNSMNRLLPRAIFVDLEPNVIDEVRCGGCRSLYHADRLVTGPEDAASNFARGFFTVGKLLLKSVNREIRKCFESCSHPQGFLVFRALGGGTGSGLTSAIFDTLTDYAKITKVDVPVFPSPRYSSSTVEPYNAVLAEHFCLEDIDVGLLFDNEAIYDICSRYLESYHPTFTTINRLISQLCSSITASIRFENALSCDLSVLQTNLVPYPRIHFPLCNYAPLISGAKADIDIINCATITKAVFERENQMMKINADTGHYMACALFYRGNNISPQNIYKVLMDIKRDQNIRFVDWCPTGFKIGINSKPPISVPNCVLETNTMNLAMLTNSSSVGEGWRRLTRKFFLIYSKRSFLHWYVGEGLEESEFQEAIYNISSLVRDYESVVLDSYTEEENIEQVSKVGKPELNFRHSIDDRFHSSKDSFKRGTPYLTQQSQTASSMQQHNMMRTSTEENVRKDNFRYVGQEKVRNLNDYIERNQNKDPKNMNIQKMNTTEEISQIYDNNEDGQYAMARRPSKEGSNFARISKEDYFEQLKRQTEEDSLSENRRNSQEPVLTKQESSHRRSSNPSDGSKKSSIQEISQTFQKKISIKNSEDYNFMDSGRKESLNKKPSSNDEGSRKYSNKEGSQRISGIVSSKDVTPKRISSTKKSSDYENRSAQSKQSEKSNQSEKESENDGSQSKGSSQKDSNNYDSESGQQNSSHKYFKSYDKERKIEKSLRQLDKNQSFMHSKHSENELNKRNSSKSFSLLKSAIQEHEDDYSFESNYDDDNDDNVYNEHENTPSNVDRNYNVLQLQIDPGLVHDMSFIDDNNDDNINNTTKYKIKSNYPPETTFEKFKFPKQLSTEDRLNLYNERFYKTLNFLHRSNRKYEQNIPYGVLRNRDEYAENDQLKFFEKVSDIDDEDEDNDEDDSNHDS